MNWNHINTAQDLEAAKSNSRQKPALIFKHSTSCSISAMALNRLERSWKEAEMSDVAIYYLDLLKHRDLSQLIAQTFDVRHESPQILLIQHEQCVYHVSHMGINYQVLREQVKQVNS